MYDFQVHGTPEDASKVNQSIAYLAADPEVDNAVLASSANRAPIQIVHDGADMYNFGGNEVYWDPSSALITSGSPLAHLGKENGPIGYNPWAVMNGNTTNGGVQSPALGLLHELGHAFDYIIDPNGYLQRVGTPDFGYKDAEEKYDINGLVTRVARYLGEPTRTNHASIADLRVDDPTWHALPRDLSVVASPPASPASVLFSPFKP
jgi:hypothetical protein